MKIQSGDYGKDINEIGEIIENQDKGREHDSKNSN
jgi:hypothetical protein